MGPKDIPRATFNDNNSPLTETTSGISDDLDALAAYVSSLGKDSLMRSPEGCFGGTCNTNKQQAPLSLPATAANCHAGSAFRDGQSHDMDTIKEAPVPV